MFTTLAQNNAGGAIAGLLILVIYLAILVLIFAGMWKMFVKAGQPGWGAIVPIYNVYLLLKIVGRPGWWLILFLIPIVSFVVWIVLVMDIAKSFGRGMGTAIGLFFLSFIFIPILGFGEAEYQGPSAG
ncbi:MAG: hypothetical protein JKY43_01895 [Phycisphaerales bacterium]|nr:hypothetical protein [Phycisphaerales bacterium]